MSPAAHLPVTNKAADAPPSLRSGGFFHSHGPVLQQRRCAGGPAPGVDVGDVGAGAVGPSHRDGLGLIGPRSSSATAPSTRAPPANAPAQSASCSTVAPITAPTSGVT